jgi:nucleotide-binding universal stress UspA family protein
MAMKTILAAIDFSPVSTRVERAAVALARAVDGRLVLLHCVVPPVIANDMMPAGFPIAAWMDAMQKAAQRRLGRLQRALAKSGVAVETICTTGFATAEVLSAAKKAAADYIVLGSHGHTAFYDLVIGSTASGVLKRASCPVVVVPAQKKTSPRRGRGK